MESLNDESLVNQQNENISRRIFVGNISFRAGRRMVMEFFSQFGEVEHCYLVEDHTRRRRKGIGFVTFKNESSVEAALQSQNLELDGREMRVKRAEKSQRWKLRGPFRHQGEIPGDISGGDIGSGDNRGADISGGDIGSGDNRGADISGGDISGGDISEISDSPQNDGLVASLPEDLLIIVFTYLPVKDKLKCEQVSRLWLHAVRKSWLRTRHLNFKGIFSGFRGLTNDILQSVLSKGCQNLVSLDVSASVRSLTEKALEIIGHFCANLEKLNIAALKVTNMSMEMLAKRCNKLKWLNVERCYVGEKGMWWVFHQCKQLAYVNLCDNPQITGQCFHMLGSELHTIILSKCSQLQHVGVHKLAERNPNLTSLHLHNCWQLIGQAVTSISQHLLKLKVLEMSGEYSSMTKDDLLGITSLLTLEELNVSSNRLIADEFLLLLSKTCKNIKVLDLSGCYNPTGLGLCALGDLPCLHTLSISYNIEFTDVPLQAIASNGQLVTLTARACTELTDAGLSFLAQNCDKLQKLDLSGCAEITVTTINAFIQFRDSTQGHDLHIITGGTCIRTADDIDTPSWLAIDSNNYSQARLRMLSSDIELDMSDEDGLDIHDYHDAADDDILAADDPLDDEEFELS